MEQFLYSGTSIARTETYEPIDQGYIELAESILEKIREEAEEVLQDPNDESIGLMIETLSSDYIDILSMGNGRIILENFVNKLQKTKYWSARAV